MSALRFEPLGECALLLHFGDRIDAALNARALATAELLRGTGLPGIVDVAPAYASVCVRYDPLAWSAPHAPAYECLAARIRHIVENAQPDLAPTPKQDAPIEIPVCYGGEFGPDLAELARDAGLVPDAFAARHADGDYCVAMLGFAPGFAYLLGLHATLHAPRRANPRTRVPAGSVAIGGAQTGIYPCELPGGWQLIGRTPLTLFDPARAAPALLQPGQRVRFRAIGTHEFAALAR